MARLLILTTEPQNFVPQELEKEAVAAGWEIEIINPDHCALNVSEKPTLFHKGEEVKKADACIPRMSEDNQEYKSAIMDFLAAAGTRLLNTSESMKLASCKLQTQILLNAAEIKTPNSAIVVSVDQLESAHKSIGGKFPLVLKTLTGTHGVGVMRVDSEASLMSVAQTLEKLETQYMIQEYIEHDASRRILLLNGEVIACVSRSVPKNDFRTNAHQGAELTFVKDPSQKEIDICKKVCELIGTKLGAVDYIVVKDEIIVFELNGSPGWESMQEVVKDVNIAKLVVAAYELTGDSDEVPQTDQKDIPPEAVDGELVTQPEDKKEQKPPESEPESEKEESVDVTKTVEVDEPDAKTTSDEKTVDMGPAVTATVDVDGEDKKTPVVGSVHSFLIKRFNDNKPVQARVDTGAAWSSIAGSDISVDNNMVSFTFGDTKYRCHVARMATIKSANGNEERPIVKFDIEIDGIELSNVDFSINDRDGMKYDALLGRNTLSAAGVLINPAMGEVPNEEKTEESTKVDKAVLANMLHESILFNSKANKNFKFNQGQTVLWLGEETEYSGKVKEVLFRSILVSTGENTEVWIKKEDISKVVL